jgi:hypothetical protein
MSLPKCSCAKLVEGGGVACGIVVVAVALRPHPQVIPVHRVQANNPAQAKHVLFRFLLFLFYKIYSLFEISKILPSKMGGGVRWVFRTFMF